MWSAGIIGTPVIKGGTASSRQSDVPAKQGQSGLFIINWGSDCALYLDTTISDRLSPREATVPIAIPIPPMTQAVGAIFFERTADVGADAFRSKIM